MKLVRFGPQGNERPGMIDALGHIRDLSNHVDDIDARCLDPQVIKNLRRLDPDGLPRIDSSVRLGAAIQRPGKFVAIGLNYADHAREANLPIPKEPIVFLKATSCCCGPNDDIVLPKDCTKGDWEVELGVVMGRTARYVEESEALAFVAGYSVINDVSERAFQFDRGGTWDKGNGCDTFGPVGPWLVTADEVPAPQNLDIWLDLNGRRMQTGNTRTMIFSVVALIAYVSRFMTLDPGDIITTGTPPGVGMGMKPEPVYLKPGDLMRLGIAGLGEQLQRVVAWR